MQVLIVEDDHSLGAFLQQGMQLEGHSVTWVQDGEAALAHAKAEHSDLVLLDLSLPKCDGVEVLAELRARHDDVAVLVLTGRIDLDARVKCLNMGADDCLLKPFRYSELIARCRAVLRRRQKYANPMLRSGDVEMDRIEHKVTCAGQDVSLTATEFSLLEYMLQHTGKCVSRKELLAEVWRMSEQTGTNVVDVYVNYLRRKLYTGGGIARIETVRGAGYRFADVGGKPMQPETGRTSPVCSVASA